MPIDASELLVKLSTGSTSGLGNANTSTPAASLGGQMASSQITSAQLNNLFDDISGADNAALDVEYRCFFFHNSDAALALTNSRVYMVGGDPAGGANMAIGLDPAGVLAFNTASAMAAVIANENAAPAGVTFTTPSTYAGGLTPGSGTVGANQAFAVWVRRTATNSAAVDPDTVVVRLEGDTPP